jgi:hypothetical protein
MARECEFPANAPFRPALSEDDMMNSGDQNTREIRIACIGNSKRRHQYREDFKEAYLM